MQNTKLVFKRSQSECLPLQPKIISPAPIKQTSRVSPLLANEIFDFPKSALNSERQSIESSISHLARARFASAKIEYDFTNEWNSESSCTTSSHGDCDSPNMMISKNPYHQEHIFEEIADEIPSRASNPIINDSNFKKYNKDAFESASQAQLFSRLNNFGF